MSQCCFILLACNALRGVNFSKKTFSKTKTKKKKKKQQHEHFFSKTCVTSFFLESKKKFDYFEKFETLLPKIIRFRKVFYFDWSWHLLASNNLLGPLVLIFPLQHFRLVYFDCLINGYHQKCERKRQTINVPFVNIYYFGRVELLTTCILRFEFCSWRIFEWVPESLIVVPVEVLA